MRGKRVGLLALCAGVLLSACCCEECRIERLDDGDYVLTHVSGSIHGVAYPWLEGAQLHVDRTARLMTIRYQRDGTTYEVRYTLTTP